MFIQAGNTYKYGCNRVRKLDGSISKCRCDSARIASSVNNANGNRYNNERYSRGKPFEKTEAELFN